MPRTAAKGGRKKDNRSPHDIYNSLEYHKQLVCWNYYQFYISNGAQGWNPGEAGSVFHQRSSSYLLSLGSDSWFRHLGKQMVTLAEKLAQLRQSNPLQQPPKTPDQPPQIVLADPRPPPRPVPLLPSLSPRQEAAESLPNLVMQSPRTPLRGTSSQAASSGTLNMEHGITAPTSFGMWKQFNYTSRKTTTSMLIRMIVHNAVRSQDIQFEWATSKRLKLRIAWPEWFQYAEQMATFTTNADRTITFPPEHPLTMDTSERNQSLVEEDDRIWDEGYLIFDEEMKNEEPSLELLEVTVSSQNKVVNVLQIVAEIAPVDESTGSTRKTVTKNRQVRIGTGVTTAGPANARTAAERESDEDVENDDEYRPSVRQRRN